MQNASEVQMQSCKESADAKRKDKAAKAKAAKGKAAKRAAGAKLQRQSCKESCKRQSCKGRSGKGKEAQRESCKRLVIPRILHQEGGISRLQSSHNRGIHLWLHRSSGHLLWGGLVRRARGGCGVDRHKVTHPTSRRRICASVASWGPAASTGRSVDCATCGKENPGPGQTIRTTLTHSKVGNRKVRRPLRL